MTKYAKKDLRDTFQEQIKKYKATIGFITPEERKELNKWAIAGNNPYDNPYLLYGDDGRPMYFIDAMRITQDMLRNPEDYYWNGSAKTFAEDMSLINASTDGCETGINLEEGTPLF